MLCRKIYGGDLFLKRPMTLIYRFAYRQLHSASQRMVKVYDALYLGETGLYFGLFGGEQRLLRRQHLQSV